MTPQNRVHGFILRPTNTINGKWQTETTRLENHEYKCRPLYKCMYYVCIWEHTTAAYSLRRLGRRKKVRKERRERERQKSFSTGISKRQKRDSRTTPPHPHQSTSSSTPPTFPLPTPPPPPPMSNSNNGCIT